MEIINHTLERGNIRYALFDFDGTLSLIRQGWEDVMIPMMVELLQQTPQSESESDLTAVVTEFVNRLTGQQTIYQTIELARQITRRGGQAQDPLVYKKMYLDRLWQRIEGRVAALKAKEVPAESMLVPGSVAVLQALKTRGVTCYLASGTDEPFVIDETEALGLTHWFAGIYGAQDNYRNFSKQMVINRIVAENKLGGSELVIFGDGYVEIENAKTVGGIAVGVATNEETRSGINEWKRERLLNAGADIIVPDFREADELVAYLFAKESKT